MNFYSLFFGTVAFYLFALFMGWRIRQFRDRQQWVKTVNDYFETSSAQATCLCENTQCDCDAQTDKHRDDQQTTD